MIGAIFSFAALSDLFFLSSSFTNSYYIYPAGNFDLIDRATPQSAYTKPSYVNPQQDMVLVFSDEFEQDGRTFYPGDDPYWEAVDLHYWGTNDLEWYDPAQGKQTSNSSPQVGFEINYKFVL